MTEQRSQFINFVSKFLGTVIFRNDQIAKIIGYGDYQLRNVTISQVYYVEGLRHNLFSVGQFHDSDLEVAFRKHTCYVRNLDGDDLLSGSRDINLYTISLDDILKSSPICLLSKALKTKSWLWHRRLSHLNFDTLNQLAKQGLVRGPPKLKFKKDHLCSACSLGKSKKSSHKPKTDNTNQENSIFCIWICASQYVWRVNIEDLDTLKANANIGICVGFAPAKKAFHIYNKRTRLIMETIHVTFDELTSMASAQNHPLANVIRDPSRLVFTRKQLKTDAMWCYFNAFLTSIELKNFKKAMLESSWIEAMQEEIHEFEQLEVVKEALEKTPLSLGQSSSQGQSAIQAVESLFEYQLKKILYEKMHKSQTNLTRATHQELFDALTWSMLLDEANMEKEEPVEDLVFEKASDNIDQTFYDKMDTADETLADAIPKILKKDWFKKAPRPETLNPNWNTIKTVDDTPEQSWFNEMVQAEKPPLMFDELMSTPIDFSTFSMNRLKLDKIIREILVGQCSIYSKKAFTLQDKDGQLTIPVKFFFNNDLEYLKVGNKERTYSSSITKTPVVRYTMEGIEDIIPTLWSPVIIVYDKDVALGISHWGPQRQQYYKATLNTVSKHKVFSTMRILSVFKEGDFLDLHLNDIEDMLLLIAQNKLFNLDGDVIVDFVTALKMFTREIIVKNRVEDVQLDPPGDISMKNYNKKKRLMHANEVNKFCDGTLQLVHKILCERILNFKFGHNKDMPLREWTAKDKKRIGIMVNKIDDRLLKRQILRSLEILVGDRKKRRTNTSAAD
ncbi:integrase, catalytic region, zinc finger, CCHC-type containing protein, partial [Tanacetum coccineum]